MSAALPRPIGARKAMGPVSAGPRAVRLWLPLTPLAVVATPVAVVAATLMLLSRRFRRANPWRWLWGMPTLLLSLSGAEVAVQTRSIRFRITIL